MSDLIRQALVKRLGEMSALKETLADFEGVAGVPVRFLPARFWVEAEGGEAGGKEGRVAGISKEGELVGCRGREPVGFCARLAEMRAGADLCRRFRQRLQERAGEQAECGRCDAGLWEILVPVRLGGRTAGHLLVSGCRGESVDLLGNNRARHLLGRAGVVMRVPELEALRGACPELGADKREALMRLLEMAAERLARALGEQLAGPSTAMPLLIEKVCRLVKAEYAGVLRLPELASRLGVSAGHLSRSFHHATGLRLVDYVARYRAERARERLRGGAESVAEVARGCGFTSLSQFNRVFRAVYGATPRVVRRG